MKCVRAIRKKTTKNKGNEDVQNRFDILRAFNCETMALCALKMHVDTKPNSNVDNVYYCYIVPYWIASDTHTIHLLNIAVARKERKKQTNCWVKHTFGDMAINTPQGNTLCYIFSHALVLFARKMVMTKHHSPF